MPPPTPPSPAIAISDLSHSYRRHQAIQHISFAVSRQSIHGFVGPNGAGKTTTLKIIATLMRPQQGKVSILGLDVVSDYKEIRGRLGYMPDHFSMYRQMTIFEYLDFFGAAYGMRAAQREATIKDILELTDMSSRKDSLIKSLSRGMQQRVSLARALVHDPDLLLLDEPASGLDPRARIELMEILKALRDLGKTIFISSHILSELADLCDEVTIVDRGSVRFSGSVSALMSQAASGAPHRLVLEGRSQAAAEALSACPHVSTCVPLPDAAGYRLTFDHQLATPAAATTAALQAALQAGAQIISFAPESRHLNQAFMDLTEPGVRT